MSPRLIPLNKTFRCSIFTGLFCVHGSPFKWPVPIEQLVCDRKEIQDPLPWYVSPCGCFYSGYHYSFLARKRKALLVGIAYTPSSSPATDDGRPGWMPLFRTHDDVAILKRFLKGRCLSCVWCQRAHCQHNLIEHCSFEEENIIVMVDTQDTPPHLQPTRENIVRSFTQLAMFLLPGNGFIDAWNEKAPRGRPCRRQLSLSVLVSFLHCHFLELIQYHSFWTRQLGQE